MKVPCNVIRDLLPLYHDSVCSPETAALVEEHLKDCDACQEEFHKLQANLLPLPLPVPGKEEQKAQGLAKVKKILRKKRVIVAAIVAAVTIVLCYGGYLFLQLPIMGESIESVHSVSVEEETGRLVVGLQSDYSGIGGVPLAAEEDDETSGTIVVLNSIYCLADPLTHFLQGTLSWKEEQVSDYYTPLTLESALRYDSIPWIEERDEAAMEALRPSMESSFPGGDVTAVYFYTGPARKAWDRDYVRNHLEDQCTLLWTAEDGVMYNP